LTIDFEYTDPIDKEFPTKGIQIGFLSAGFLLCYKNMFKSILNLSIYQIMKLKNNLINRKFSIKVKSMNLKTIITGSLCKSLKIWSKNVQNKLEIQES